MASITLKGNHIETVGELPEQGAQAPDFQMVKTDLSEASLHNYRGKKVLLNIFPSIDTGVCAASVRKFNESAAGLENTKVLCISRDLPFAQARFCGAEGIENVEMLSDYRTGEFGRKYGLEISSGPMRKLHSRAVLVLDEKGNVKYSQQVPEITDEPDYDSALAALK